MSKKALLISAFFLLIPLLFLAACARSASTAPTATPTGQKPANTPVQTGMSMMAIWGTETSIGEQTRTAEGLPPLATMIPIAGTSTSTPLVPPTGAPTDTLLPGVTPVILTPVPLVRPATYTLKSGEFPYCIARRYNLDQDELLALNGLTPSSAGGLPVGYVLKIPQTGNPFVGSRILHPHPVTYTVAVNDTIYRVACYFGDVDPAAIAANNNLTAPYVLITGRVLNIP